MVDLNINFEATTALGNQVITKSSEFQDLLNKVKNINNDLQSYWQGDDSAKYSARVAEQAEVMQQLTNTINEIGEYLLSVSKAYQDFVNENAGAIN